METPCTWPIEYSACQALDATTGLPAPLSGMDPAQAAMIESMATSYLWNWTDRRFGLCEVTLRPCTSNCPGGRPSTFWGNGPYSRGSMSVYGPWMPALLSGRWYNLSCGTCAGACTCGDGPASLALPGPVAGVVEVREDGLVLPTSAYRVDDYRYLVRQDGSAWRRCQDMSADTTATDTWSVTYNRGVDVPPGGKIAAGVLAMELAKAWCKDNTCALPQRIQSITRQGITVAVLDSMDDVDKGHTGIWLIDSWIASVMKIRQGGTVHSVDLMGPRTARGRTTTWRAP